ncbi:hypothetical protein [Methylobacterium radiotolerans]|uniref:Uncharacterized protein n=1 Tax=Methylobacterium radiotolerans (strain ATCC 27329 / DSM 1819 / JCM 2831 / NBRC 15690 / NCIMB 10815 / 0-1) TaxID=426355 RepID=B1LXE0_METRJ|nr:MULTISPECIES: hypothetical protein [Methylobacterium]ACB27261.1 hypothetical protein Mrad2831_5314 [Methylobacterium radiotolerans JCM 2831]GEM98242.1 hypothetical protein MRA01_27820 [Methylobacterium radiotolerans]
MTEGERNQILNRVFAVIRDRAAEMRKSSDFYESSYVAGEIARLPGYIVPRVDAGLIHDPVVVSHEEFTTLWNGLRWRGAEVPDFDWLDRLKGRVDAQLSEDEE